MKLVEIVNHKSYVIVYVNHKSYVIVNVANYTYMYIYIHIYIYTLRLIRFSYFLITEHLDYSSPIKHR
jgi:hypothetical protein